MLRQNNSGTGNIRLDHIVYIICILNILLFTILIFLNIFIQGDERGFDKVGNIVYSKNYIQTKHSSRVTWNNLQRNDPVFLGDSIMTLENSSAIIQLDEGTGITIDKSTKIKLRENTIIQLVKTSDTLFIDLTHGSITINKPHLNKSGLKKIIINSDGKSIDVNSGKVNILSNKKEINVSVFKGSVVVSTGEKKENILEGDGASLSKDTEGISLFKSKVKLLEPEFNKYFITLSDFKEVKFKWDKIFDDALLIISKQKDFNKKIATQKVESNAAVYSLPAGTYYWGLVQGQKKEMLTNTGKFTILQVKPIELMLPMEGAMFSYYSRPVMIDFQWKPGQLAFGYVLEVASDKEFKKIVKSINVQDNEISLDSFKEGEYFWRIKKIIPPDFSIETVKSPVRSFMVKKSDKMDIPEFIKLIPAKNISQAEMKEKSQIYSCEYIPEITKYRFLFSKDKDFKEVLYQVESDKNFITVDLEFFIGKYYWNVIGTTSDSSKITSRKPGSFYIISNREIKLLSPENKSYIYANEKTGLGKVLFKWNNGVLEGNSIFKIYKDRELKSIYKKEIVSEDSLEISDLRPGEYFWQIAFLDRSGGKVIESKTYAFVLYDVLKPPFVITPARNMLINTRNRENVLFAWNKSKGANFYKFEIYRIINGKSELLFKGKTDKNNYKISDLRLLKPGKFYWTLQAFEKSGQGDEIIRKSKIVKEEFKTTLGSSLTKPKLESIEVQ